MKQGICSNSMTYELNTTARTNFRNDLIEQDILSQLKGKVFEKDQNHQNYENLLAKYHKLQDDLEKLIQLRNRQEILLHQEESNDNNILISELKNKNDDLFNKLNEQIAINSKLYKENNVLFKQLECQKNENNNMKEEIFRQEDLIRKLSYEKDDIQKIIYNLNQMREKQEFKIDNCNEEINKYTSSNDGQRNLIRSKSSENIDIFNKINDEKRTNQNLLYELKGKEDNLIFNQQKLNCLNEKINGLKNDINILTNNLYNINDEIDNVNNDILKEKSELNSLIIDNKSKNNYIHDREIQIQNMNKENNLIKENNCELEQDSINMNNIIGIYQKHLLFLISQNKKLSSELQLLLGRDEEIKLILNRKEFLRDFKDENNRLITNSIENISTNLEDNSIQYENKVNSNSVILTYSVDTNDLINNNIHENKNNEINNNIPKNNNSNNNELNEKKIDRNDNQKNNDIIINKDDEIQISNENINIYDNNGEEEINNEEELINMSNNENEAEHESEN